MEQYDCMFSRIAEGEKIYINLLKNIEELEKELKFIMQKTMLETMIDIVERLKNMNKLEDGEIALAMGLGIEHVRNF